MKYQPAHYPSKNLSTSLRIAGGEIASANAVVLIMKVENHGATEAYFCNYHTPFEGVRNIFLQVIGPKGKEIDYRGMMAKRLAPGPEHYIRLEPGTSTEVEFDPSEAYSFAQSGLYRLKFIGNESINGLPDSEEIRINIP